MGKEEKLRRLELEPGEVDDEDLEYQFESLLEEASESESHREQNGEEFRRRLEVFRLWWFVLLFIAFFAWGFVKPKDNSSIEWLHGIAHGAGRVVVLCIGIVLFSASKFSLQKLGAEALGFIHGTVGSVFAVVGLGFHAAPWIYLVAIKDYEMQGSLWSTQGFPNATQMVVTGSLLTLMVLFLLISTRERIRKGGKRRVLFKWLHPVLYASIVMLLVLHGNATSRALIIGPILTYAVDRVLRVLLSQNYRPKELVM
ncbi:hypothetical protein NDN08_001784 [Rhodosorus marinus]|uniref:Ferric oxidoreductase domain-containing protein n=1 Tax=Rhodosorus marinus TaxID=101924 RepID=A0AAV8UW32_9RHOD|nr:hypothetical protein NDN08_001784 [Rhodosorus marinus]